MVLNCKTNLVIHQPMRNTTRAISMMILSIPTTTPAVKEVNHSSAASFSMLVTSGKATQLCPFWPRRIIPFG